MTADIDRYYYGTPLATFEYMRMALSGMPEEIITQYNMAAIASDGWVYIQIEKGMPGLKQAGKIANDRLTHHLAKYGYAPVPRTPSLWKHHTRSTIFTLVVDDFGIRYNSEQDANHLLNALRDLYDISVDWAGKLYCGLTLAWDYHNRTC